MRPAGEARRRQELLLETEGGRPFQRQTRRGKKLGNLRLVTDGTARYAAARVDITYRATRTIDSNSIAPDIERCGSGRGDSGG